MKKLLIILFLISVSFYSFSQQKIKEKERPKPTTRILFVFDASQSMYGRWQSDMKITIAQKMIANLLDSLVFVPNLQLAMRVYGHQKPFPPQDCDDTKLEVPFSFGNIPKIKSVLKQLVPKGTTPIAISLEQSGNDFPPCENCRNIIILITDGIEECGGDPCAVSKALQKKGIVLKPFVIGIGRDFKSAFDCIGTYFDASSEKIFKKVLNVVISQALNSTTAQVNLLDIEGKPTETNVNMSFYDSYSGNLKYNFIHTMNNRGNPDTLVIDPLTTYKLTIHTIPPVTIDTVKLTAGKHTIIPVDVPQGFLSLKLGGKSNPSQKPIPCIVRKKGKMETINVQNFEQTEKYLVGKYDIEVLCLPRIYLKDIDISQSKTTTIEIPQPGMATITTGIIGYGSLYLEDDNKLTWLYNFRENTTVETLILEPGKYRVVYRSKFSTKSDYTTEKSFKVESGSAVNVKVYSDN